MSELPRRRLAVRIGRIAALASVLLIGSMACAAPPQSDVLKTLPNVATVEAKPIDKPTHYIIHVLDWHFVGKAEFVADLQGQGITDDLHIHYAKHLDDVEAVQAEQRRLLTSLTKNYGVTKVYVEGLTKDDVKKYTDRATEFHAIRRALEMLQELQRREDPKAKLYTAKLSHRSEALRLGAVGRLVAEGGLKALPAEDKAAYEAASPVRKGGKVKFDPMLNDAREDAIVENVLEGGPVSILILGGAHDLSDNVPEGCQYIRVGTKAYETMAAGQ